jgi:hypothetical protein
MPSIQETLESVKVLVERAQEQAEADQKQTAAVLYAQAAFTLGMQLGHFRSVLGVRFPESPECAAFSNAVAVLNEAIIESFAEVDEDDGEEEDEEEDAPAEVPSKRNKGVPYGYTASVHEEDE